MPSAALTLSSFSGGANPNNAATSDNVYATIAVNVGGGVGFSFKTNATSVVPAGQVIYGVVLTVEAYITPAGAAADNTVAPIGGLSFPSITVGSTETVYTRGSSTDPLGITDASQLSNVSLRFGGGSVAGTFYVDCITVTVHYGPPISGNALFFGENF
jgi:hypothetical protein